MLSAERAGAGRTVLVEPVEREGARPDCGVLSSRIQARPVHRVRDVQCGGEPLEVRFRKRRLACLEPQCPRRSFVQTTDEIPLRSRLTSRLVAGIVADLSAELRAVSRVAAASGVSWTTAMRVMEDTAVLDGSVDRRLFRRLGVDEHRFRRVRYLKNDVTRVEPWSIVFTDLDTGAILDIVDGRRGQAVRDWIGARPRWWRNKVEMVAMDMSTEFRRAIRKVLPKAAITVDHWHVVARANQMVTEVRRRRAHDLHGRRGRATDPAWKYRKLLTCNQENMSSAQRGRMQEIIGSDLELGVVWGIKEHVRQLLKTDHIDGFHRAWAVPVSSFLKVTTGHLTPEASSVIRVRTCTVADPSRTSTVCGEKVKSRATGAVESQTMLLAAADNPPPTGATKSMAKASKYLPRLP